MNTTLISDSSPKLIKEAVDAIIAEGNEIVQVVQLSKTMYLVISKPIPVVQ